MPIIDNLQIIVHNTTDDKAIDDFIAANPNLIWDGEIFDNKDYLEGDEHELLILGQLSEEYEIVFPENDFVYEVVLCESDELYEEDE